MNFCMSQAGLSERLRQLSFHDGKMQKTVDKFMDSYYTMLSAIETGVWKMQSGFCLQLDRENVF